jgi:hypothetical protein
MRNIFQIFKITRIFSILMSVAAMAMPFEASATIINENVTLDLTTGVVDLNGGDQFFHTSGPTISPSPITVVAGDVVNLTLKFLPGQSITFTNDAALGNKEIVALGFDPARGPGSSTDKTSFLGASGFTAANFNGGFNSVLGLLDFGNLTNATATFSGLASTITVATGSFTGDDIAFFDVEGGTVTIDTREPVPEPATLALLGVGLAGLGMTRRYKSA